MKKDAWYAARVDILSVKKVMSIRPDTWIKKMAFEKDMIRPFEPEQIRNDNISYGLSSFGYDIRLADEFKIFKGSASEETAIDPKRIRPDLFEDFRGNECIIQPHSFVLARSLEYFKIPRNVLALCTGKSTYARIGVIVNVTPLEPCWEGYLTIEISNTSPLPVKLYANEGIAQVVFFASDGECEVSYADRKGRYQAQKEITLPK